MKLDTDFQNILVKLNVQLLQEVSGVMYITEDIAFITSLQLHPILDVKTSLS